MVEVIKYNSDKKVEWDQFLNESKNSSFLFKRDFMEYHSSRFDDYSLMIYYDKVLVAVIPANLKDNILYSHQGLTYGGAVVSDEIRLSEFISVIREVLFFLNSKSISAWNLKLIPRMYNQRSSDEIDWILFKLGAQNYRRDLALAIDNSSFKINYQERRKRSIKKALKHDLRIVEGLQELAPFWNEVLSPNLLEKHDVLPVHSLGEIEKLSGFFPKNIKQHNIYLDGKIAAGCTMFLNKQVAHAQYISSTLDGRNSGAIDYLFDQLITEAYKTYKFFDFGISNESYGEKINKGLLDWKEGFGARSILHDFYRIDTSTYHLLDDIYI